MIFKNWLDTRLKMETHDPNVYSTILGGVSQGFWSLLLDWGARRAVFWHLKTGTFGKSGCGHSILVGMVQFFGTVLRYHRHKTYQKNKVIWDTFGFLTHPTIHILELHQRPWGHVTNQSTIELQQILVTYVWNLCIQRCQLTVQSIVHCAFSKIEVKKQ